MAAKRGGKRAGAGRPLGASSRASQAMKATLTELARKHTSIAIKALVDVATKSESDSARVAAANAILDRGYGKPAQSHEHSGPGGGPIQAVDLTKCNVEQLRALEFALVPFALAAEHGAGEGEGGDPAAGS